MLLLPNGSDRVTTAPQQAVQTDKIIEDEGVKALLAVRRSCTAVPAACLGAGAVCRGGVGVRGALHGRWSLARVACDAPTRLFCADFAQEQEEEEVGQGGHANGGLSGAVLTVVGQPDAILRGLRGAGLTMGFCLL